MGDGTTPAVSTLRVGKSVRSNGTHGLYAAPAQRGRRTRKGSGFRGVVTVVRGGAWKASRKGTPAQMIAVNVYDGDLKSGRRLTPSSQVFIADGTSLPARVESVDPESGTLTVVVEDGSEALAAEFTWADVDPDSRDEVFAGTRMTLMYGTAQSDVPFRLVKVPALKETVTLDPAAWARAFEGWPSAKQL